MMKYVIAMVMAAVMVLSEVSGGDWLVYSYKANIKRMDTKITKAKYSFDVYDKNADASILIDTYKTASDTLSGYLMIPVCIGCSEVGSDSSIPFGESYLYVIRRSDKTKAVWKFMPELDAGLFSKDVAPRPENDVLAGYPTSLKKLNQSWVGLNFFFEDMGLAESYDSYLLPYGFLGYTSSEGAISSVGFGEAKTVTNTVSSGLGLCDPLETTSCSMITAVKDGRIVGKVTHQGVCGAPSIWDVCSLEQTLTSVLYGSWSIRLNSKISASVNDMEELTDVEEFLINKLGGKSLVE